MGQHISTHHSIAGNTLVDSKKSVRFNQIPELAERFPVNQILIVDDDRFTRQVLSLFLQKGGVKKVWNATNGEEALEILATNSGIGCVLLDIYMPIKDGMELLQLPQLRAPGMTVCLMSSKTDHTLSHAQKLATAYGVNVIGALRKPFQSEQLSFLFEQR